MGSHAVSTDDPAVFTREIQAVIGRKGVSVLVAKTTRSDCYQDVMASLNKPDVYAVQEKP